MIAYDDALLIVKREFKKIKTDIINLPLEESTGYFLAEDILTDTYLPPFDNSSMDGFAVKYIPDVFKWKITGEISAGNFENLPFENDTAVRIMTGGKLPENFDTVIPLEDIVENNNEISLIEGSHFFEGMNIRKKGEDISPGILVLPKSTLLKPQNISIAAACGKSNVKVFEKIKVGIIATGDELIDVAIKPEGDKIRATNLYTIISLVKQSGMIPVNLGMVKDDKQILTEKIASALDSDINILITTGGVSVGKYDYLKDIYNELNAEIYFTKVNIKPGKPVVFGRSREKLIFGLPGNPVSSFVSFIIFIREALRNNGKGTDAPFNAKLQGSIKKSDSKKHFVRGISYYDFSEKTYYAKAAGAQSSGNMAGLNDSDCLIIFPEEKGIIENGEIVNCIWL